MQNNILVSIIIPCYNAAKYLPRTFRALAKQTYQNFEVILINDGSIDNTKDVAEKLCNNHDSCHLYSYENAGVSVARNRGLEHAIGDYIWFLDADDWFVPELLDDMVKLIVEHDYPDDISFLYQWIMDEFDENNHFSLPNINPTIRALSGNDIFEGMTKNIIGFSNSDMYQYFNMRKWNWKEERNTPWSHLYKRSFLLNYNIRFIPGMRSGEDRVFNCEVMLYASKVVTTDKKYYYYLSTNTGSLRKKNDAVTLYFDKQNLVLEREKLRQLYLNVRNIDIKNCYQGSNVLACFQLAVNLSETQFNQGRKLYRQFVRNKYIRNAYNSLDISNAPLKIKIPILMLRKNLDYVFYTLLFIVSHLGVKLIRHI